MSDERHVAEWAEPLPTWVLSGRLAHGMTQAELAKRLGITVVQISKLENGHAETTLKTLRKMCGIFGKTFTVTA